MSKTVAEMTPAELREEISSLAGLDQLAEQSSLQCPMGYSANMQYCRLMSLRDELKKRVLATDILLAKWLREERWDVLGRLLQILETRAGRELAGQAIADALLKAGAVPDEKFVRPGKKFTPRVRLAPMVKEGERCFRFTVYSDDSIVIEPTEVPS